MSNLPIYQRDIDLRDPLTREGGRRESLGDSLLYARKGEFQCSSGHRCGDGPPRGPAAPSRLQAGKPEGWVNSPPTFARGRITNNMTNIDGRAKVGG